MANQQFKKADPNSRIMKSPDHSVVHHHGSLHKLNMPWAFWYHSTTNQDWSPESYKKILDIKNVEDIFVLWNSWEQCMPPEQEAMLFLMRKPNDNQYIHPRWEDPIHETGGYISFKIDNERLQEVWRDIVLLALGENLLKTPQNWNLVTGVSVSPKRTFCIIKIMMRTPISDNEVDSMLSDSVLNMNLGHAQCSSHKDQVQRDFARHKKHRKRGNDYSGGGAFGGGRRKQNTMVKSKSESDGWNLVGKSRGSMWKRF